MNLDRFLGRSRFLVDLEDKVRRVGYKELVEFTLFDTSKAQAVEYVEKYHCIGGHFCFILLMVSPEEKIPFIYKNYCGEESIQVISKEEAVEIYLKPFQNIELGFKWAEELFGVKFSKA